MSLKINESKIEVLKKKIIIGEMKVLAGSLISFHVSQ